jgi:hypothetical protein
MFNFVVGIPKQALTLRRLTWPRAGLMIYKIPYNVRACIEFSAKLNARGI